MLHGDLDGGGSSYAPVPSRALRAQGAVDGWFLGHIHRPHALGVDRPLGYLGSLVGLDRGEVGARGPWLVTVAGRGSLEARQIPLGPVQWEEANVDVTDLPEDPQHAVDFLRAAVQDCFSALRRARPALAEPGLVVVAVSIAFVGAPSAHRALRTFIDDSPPDQLLFHFDDQVWTAAKLLDRTRPAVDLEALREQRGPLGLVAGVLAALEAGEELAPELEALIAAAAAPFSEGAWALDPEDFPLAPPRELLLAAARDLLQVLLNQQRSEGAG